MLRLISLLAITSLCIGSVHGSDFSHASLAAPRKLPTFVKGGRRCLSSPESFSSFLLQVRGGSDRDPRGNYYVDDDRKRSRSDDRYSPPDYDYRDENRNDDYYAQDENYYEDDGRYEDFRRYERDYDDRGAQRSPTISLNSVPEVIKYGDHKIGVALLAFGTFFTISGIMLFFHKALLRMGNLLLVTGVPMTIGPGRTAGFFFQPTKARATGFLVFGIFLVFIGWPIFGIALEIFGLLNLFGNMLPLAFTMLRQMPIVGALFPATKKKPTSRRNDDDVDDRYYGRDDRNYGDEDQGRDSGERYF